VVNSPDAEESWSPERGVDLTDRAAVEHAVRALNLERLAES
jgi:hypothetical protein